MRSCQSIVLNSLSPVLEDPAPRVYAAAVFDGPWSAASDVTITSERIVGRDTGTARPVPGGTRAQLLVNDRYAATRDQGEAKRWPLRGSAHRVSSERTHAWESPHAGDECEAGQSRSLMADAH
jgi:hypothetical protein